MLPRGLPDFDSVYNNKELSTIFDPIKGERSGLFGLVVFLLLLDDE